MWDVFSDLISDVRNKNLIIVICLVNETKNIRDTPCYDKENFSITYKLHYGAFFIKK